MNTFGGAGMGAAATRASQFLGAMDKYDRAVHAMEQLRNHRAAPATLAKAQTTVNETYLTLQREFHRELQRSMATHVSGNRTSILHPSTAKSRPIFRTMPLRSASHAQSLARFGRYGRILGPATIMADGYFRYDTVMDTYNTGGNWRREFYAQAAGFSVGVGLGLSSMFLLMGPLGWVLGIIFIGSMAVILDHATVDLVKRGYDRFHQ